MTEQDSEQLEGQVVMEQLLKVLQENGDMSIKERDHLMVLGMTSLLYMLSPLPRKIRDLERNNITMWINKHQKASTIIFFGAVLFIMFLQQVGGWISSNVAYIAKMIP